ncbi:MAG: exo-alpha-sialidase [Candidatus Malihini olakiniferum]
MYCSDLEDYGRHWSSAYPATLPNNNSGIDVVRRADGSLVLVFNPITGNWNRRYSLSVDVSRDNGE